MSFCPSCKCEYRSGFVREMVSRIFRRLSKLYSTRPALHSKKIVFDANAYHLPGSVD